MTTYQICLRIVKFALCLLVFQWPLLAQTVLQDDVSYYKNYHGAYDDYTIPSDGCGIVLLNLRGGDGGSGQAGDCTQAGGDGATLEARFRVGEGTNELRAGGRIRGISGRVGQTFIELGGAGGSSSAFLYTTASNPDNLDSEVFSENLADAASSWVILAVAGGGGGAYQGEFIGCVDNNGGGGGQSGTAGQDGYGDHYPGGTNGNGGTAAPGITGLTDIHGGGGVYSDSKRPDGSSVPTNDNTRGKKGSATASTVSDEDYDDGYGYVAYGFTTGGFPGDRILAPGGGGGGGYSGGGGGTLYFGGGGGGSFVNSAAYYQSITAGQNTPGGNTKTAGSHTIEYRADGSPVMACFLAPALTFFPAADGGIDYTPIWPYVFDECTEDADMTYHFTNANTGASINDVCSVDGQTLNVSVTATDEDGNTSLACSITATFQDFTNPPSCCAEPAANCVATNSVTINGDETIVLDLVDFALGSADCGLLSESLAPATVSCEDAGMLTVTYTITDDYDRSASCTTELTVNYLDCNDLDVDLTPGELLTLDAAALTADNCNSNAQLDIGVEQITCASFENSSSLLTGQNGAGNMSGAEFPHATSLVLNNTDDFTVEVYFKRSTTQNPNWTNYKPILSKTDGNYHQPYNIYMNTDGRLFFSRYAGSSNGTFITTNLWLAADTWYLLSAVKSGSNIYLYVNGTLYGQASDNNVINASDVVSNTAPLRVGRDQNTVPAAYGHFDELRVWDVARSQTEIQEYQYGNVRGDESGLVLYANFEAAGSLGSNGVRDFSLEENHGTFTNAEIVNDPAPTVQAVLYRSVTALDANSGSNCTADVIVRTDGDGCAALSCGIIVPQVHVDNLGCPGDNSAGTLSLTPYCADCTGAMEFALELDGSTTPYQTGTSFENLLSGRTYTLLARDGEATSCAVSTTVTIPTTPADQTAPTFTCPPNQSVSLGEDCTYTVPDLSLLVTDLSENCSAVGYIQVPAAGEMVTASHNDLFTFTLQAADGSNNRSSICQITLTAVDQRAPVFEDEDGAPTCPTSISYELTPEGSCEVLNQIDLTVSDCSALNFSVTNGTDFGMPFPMGTTSVTIRATDEANNSTDCMISIMVTESTACGLLPLSLLHFTGEITPNGNLLHWKTIDEIGFSHFLLQRSSAETPNDWALVGRVNASAGTHSAEQKIYQLLDEQPHRHNFYRLKMVDQDGSFSYGPIVSLFKDYQGSRLEIWPNPNQGIFTIRSGNPENLLKKVEIFTVDGRPVHLGEQIGESQLTLNLTDLQPGIYFVINTLGDGDRQVRRIIIQ